MKIKPAYVYQIRFKTKHKNKPKKSAVAAVKKEGAIIAYDPNEPTFSHLELSAWVAQVADMLEDLKAAQRVIGRLSPVPVT